MLTALQKSAVSLLGERWLSDEETAAELSLPLETVRGYRADPEFAKALDHALTAPVFEEARRMFGADDKEEI